MVSARAGVTSWSGTNAVYPHKAILGTAYEFATGDRLGSSDFEGGKSGAVAVLRDLWFHHPGETMTTMVNA
jgi:hypothetical protein